MEPLPCAVGDLLAGKYRIERVLGEGGMGVVVAARHVQLDRLVAIKLVRPSAAKDEVVAERFVREARAVAKLKSDHVAKVLDIGRFDSGVPYLVMEYLEGADLACVLADRGPLLPEVACDYVLQACEAVAEAHSLGIVHRDLKPENLFLTRRVGGTQVIKVLDFGISKEMTARGGALTTTRGLVGSPLYMAPEQMRSSRAADPRSDVWALGVVLYELVTARWPYEADSLADLCLQVVQQPPRPVDAVRDDLSPQLVSVIHRCLEKDPARRYANAAELASALEAFVPPASRGPAERARLAVSGASSTRAVAAGSAVTLAEKASSRGGGGGRRAIAVGALVVSIAAVSALLQGRPPPLMFAAVHAGAVVPLLAAPAATSPPAGPDLSTAPGSEASASPAASTRAQVPPTPLGGRWYPRRPPRAATAGRAPDDDIPAFR